MAIFSAVLLILLQAAFYAILDFHTAHSISPYYHSVEAEGIWTWVGGSEYRNQKSVLDGKQDYPGSRDGASSWKDSDGMVWILGGKGPGMRVALDELWSYDVERRHWHFHNFTDKIVNEQKPPPCFACTSCSHGNKAIVFTPSGTFLFYMDGKRWTALQNLTMSPPPRSHAASWCDSEKGILWIFGGLTASQQKLQDFWKFSFKEMWWVEIKPKSNESLVPNNSSQASAWIHPSGHLYMFGGSTPYGLTSDFWIFSPEAFEWSKLSGNTGPFKCAGEYGNKGVPSKNNHPGCREGAATWIDKRGDLWMFGGSGFDNFSRGAFAASETGLLSDFWKYNISSHQWLWIGGLSRNEGVPFFSEKGKADLRNIPGPREGAVSFSFGGELWLFGGAGHDVKQSDGILNDLWTYRQVKTEIPGDTLKMPFGFRVLIALFILALGLLTTMCVCYSKECRIFRLKRRLRPVVKYKPVKVEMMQVPQPEEHPPFDELADRNL